MLHWLFLVEMLFGVFAGLCLSLSPYHRARSQNMFRRLVYVLWEEFS